MPPLSSFSFFFFSSSFLLLLSTSASADKTQWDVTASSPVRDSRFLDVPVYYGNWVPINNAKATLERVAASIEAAQRKDVQPPVFVDTVKERVDVEQPQQRWTPKRPLRPQQTRLRSQSVKDAQDHQQQAWGNPRSPGGLRRNYRYLYIAVKYTFFHINIP